MKLSEYLKDKLPLYVIFAFMLVAVIIFMTSFHVPMQLTVVVGTIIIFSGISSQIWDYSRKKRFYDDLFAKLDELDQKYLITEITEEADFYDGKVMRELMLTSSKAMCDKISEYRKENNEFREFIELWVHEVKLPLSSLQLMIHNHKSEITSRASEQIRKIDSFTDTVLYYVRSENAEKDYIIKETSLKRAVVNTAVKNREDLILNNIQLKTDSLDVNVMTDGKWLEYILGQLTANSIKYVKENGEREIFIFSEEFDDSVRLCFRDNGMGIPEGDLPYVFKKSFTGENGRIRSKSTGMGLYIVKNLCDKLGHKIEVHSVRGKFTEFTIIFAKNDFYKME